MGRAWHPVLHEVRDQQGNWIAGYRKFNELAALIGTTTADLMRRLSMLGVVEYRDGRNRLTPLAKQKLYGETTYLLDAGGRRRVLDVALPSGMTLLVRNLEATNAPPTETERMIDGGLARKEVARRLGISPAAVRKRLRSVPPHLKDWPVLESRNKDEHGADNNNNNVCPRRNWPKHWLEREALWEQTFGDDRPAWPKTPKKVIQSLAA